MTRVSDETPRSAFTHDPYRGDTHYNTQHARGHVTTQTVTATNPLPLCGACPFVGYCGLFSINYFRKQAYICKHTCIHAAQGARGGTVVTVDPQWTLSVYAPDYLPPSAPP
jgi:hypothetical protein